MTEDRHSDRIWRCDDGGHHYVSLTGYDVGSRDQEVFLQIDLKEFVDGGWWEKIKHVWGILRWGEYPYGEVLLKGSDAKEFRAELDRLIKLEGSGE